MTDGDFPYAQLHAQLDGLHIFVTTARTGSFSAAARELRMTQPTISQKIAMLEGVVGRQLFHRQHRGVVLTENGQNLLRAFVHPFQEIETEFRSLQAPIDQNRVRLATDFAFSTYWLLPKLSQLQSAFPKLDLQIMTAHLPSTILRTDWDLMVEYCEDASTTDNRRVLFSESVVAVCSPAFFEKFGPFDKGEDLLHAPHITMQLGAGPQFYDWHRWYQEMGNSSKEMKVGLTTGNYTLGCQAALAGHGLFLSPKEFIPNYLINGDLVLALPFVANSPRPYIIERKPGNSNLTVNVFEWICDNGGQ